MTPQQEEHLEYLKAKFEIMVDQKYRAGQLEHGGNLFDKTPLELIDEALAENIDQFTFLMTARKKIKGIKEKYGETNIRPVGDIPAVQSLPPGNS